MTKTNMKITFFLPINQKEGGLKEISQLEITIPIQQSFITIHVVVHVLGNRIYQNSVTDNQTERQNRGPMLELLLGIKVLMKVEYKKTCVSI